MDRTQKKCFVIVAVMHGLLVLIAVLGTAFFNKDIYLVMASTLMAAALLVAGNLVADFMLAWNDPSLVARAQNLLLLASLVLNGCSGYLLARIVTRATLPSAVAGAQPVPRCAVRPRTHRASSRP